MFWVPDSLRRWRPRFQFPHGARAAILAQLGQKSTIVAVLNAVALLAGWRWSPDRIDAVATVLSVADSILLAVIQEGPPPPPPSC